MTGTPSRPQHFFSPLFPTPNLVHGRLQMWSGGKPESLPGDLTHRPGGEADSEYNFFFFVFVLFLWILPSHSLTAQPNAEVMQMDFQRDSRAECEAPGCRCPLLFRVFWQKAAH